MAGLFDKLRSQKPRVDSSAERAAVGSKTSDLWIRCTGCGTAVYRRVFHENLKVCEKCGYHHQLTAFERVGQLCDPGSFQEWDREMRSGDPLEFGEEYRSKLERDRQRTRLSDAILTGSARIDGVPVALGVMDFRFRGGSMGSVVGEKVVRALERAVAERLPVVMVTSSGGARMQEGMLSLMQMVRTAAAVRRVNRARVPYLVIMTDPTTAGVAASFAALGDVVLAEPGAIIGFAGRRVIEQTIRQKLPADFQTAEFFQQHGFVDRVVPRQRLRGEVSRLLKLLTLPVEVAP